MRRAVLLAVAASLVISSTALAQDPPATSLPALPPEAPVAVTREIDQTLVNLPTTMPLKRHHGYFRITHRFARDLRRGSFGQLAEDLFSLDSGAVIGLEYRFALTDRIQAGINRSILGKTIVTYGRVDAWRELDGHPLSISAIASIEGQNNLRLDPQPGVSITVSRAYRRLAVYATPAFVHNAHTPTLQLLHEGHSHADLGTDSSADAAAHEDETDTMFVGLGTRVRVRDTVSLVGEVSPRVWGYRPDRAAWAAGIEKLTHGHVLQLNFGNSFGTTPGQVARGGSPHDVYMGFNLSRKF